jgi:hypothetical protein
MTNKATTFTPELGERICARIAQGDSVRKACRGDGYPTWRTFMRWLATQDPEPVPGTEEGPRPFDALRQQYARAREIRADARFERIDNVVHDMRQGKINDRQARVEIDALKWQAGKENGRRYGEAVTLRGDKDNPVEVRRTARDLSDADLAAIAQGGLRGAD